jgi:gas vesicle protein
MVDEDDLDGLEEREAHRFAAGLLIGVVVGAGLALLLAPATGSRTRQALKRRLLRRRRPGLRERLERVRERLK